MTRSEAKFLAALKERLEASGAWTAKLHGHSHQRAGLPDLLVCHELIAPGGAAFLELKGPGGKLRGDQRLVLLEMLRRGAYAVVLREQGSSLRFEGPSSENGLWWVEDWENLSSSPGNTLVRRIHEGLGAVLVAERDREPRDALGK